MSLRPAKVGILKSGLKSFNAGGIGNYCTKTRSIDIVFVPSSSAQRRSNEVLGLNPSYPFRGGIGLDKTFLEEIVKKGLRSKESPLQSKTVVQPTTSEGFVRHHISEINELFDSQMRIQIDPNHTPDESLHVEVMKADRNMELKAVPCPKTIKQDLGSLFLEVKIDKAKNITVLNLTQKSTTDMSAWSEKMEEEREMLTKDFINIASAICYDLQKLGNGRYWADFIEPSSGRPYFGKYTNATLFETDDRYRDLGFQIEDLGCCKVVKHVKWSTYAFVGTIFTDAPIDSAEVKAILSNSKAGQYFQEKPLEIDDKSKANPEEAIN